MTFADLPRWPSPAQAVARAAQVYAERPGQLSLDLSAELEPDPCWTCDGDGEVECECGMAGCDECDGMGFVACPECQESC